MEELWRDTNIYYKIFCFLITENEKLFDRSDAKLYWRSVIHILSIYHHTYVGLFAVGMGHNLAIQPNPDIQCLNTFRAAYLTGWNFVFQVVFLILSLVYDILEWRRKTDSNTAARIRYWRDVIYCGLVVPYTVFVTVMFWGLYAIDRELVFPQIYDEIVPWWFNQCVHTNISILVVLETILQARRRPTDSKLEHSLYWFVGVAYAVVYYGIYFGAHRWLYPIFDVMYWWQVCLYQLSIWFGTYFIYFIQFPISRLIHGPEAVQAHVQVKNPQTDKELAEEDIVTNGKLVDLKAPPFSTKSWSLKFRNIRDQFESSKL